MALKHNAYHTQIQGKCLIQPATHMFVPNSAMLNDHINRSKHLCEIDMAEASKLATAPDTSAKPSLALNHFTVKAATMASPPGGVRSRSGQGRGQAEVT